MASASERPRDGQIAPTAPHEPAGEQVGPAARGVVAGETDSATPRASGGVPRAFQGPGAAPEDDSADYVVCELTARHRLAFDSRQFIVQKRNGAEEWDSLSYYPHKTHLLAGLARHGIEPTAEASATLAALPETLWETYIRRTGRCPPALRAWLRLPRSQGVRR